MATSRFADRFGAACYGRLSAAAVLAAAVSVASPVRAQDQQSPPEGRIVVTGVGSVHVAPDYARISSGVTTKAKTVKEASDANAKVMSAITATLLDAGIAQTDIQTSRFSVQPVYASPQSGPEPKLSGYSVSNQADVVIRQISNVGDVLDRLVRAGATNIGNIALLVSDPSKALDQAREAAVADARRKAELYARASGVNLGRVLSIKEDAVHGVAVPFARASAMAAAPVPISTGEDTLEARITMGYEITR